MSYLGAWVFDKKTQKYIKTSFNRPNEKIKIRFICIIRKDKNTSYWNTYDPHVLWADNLNEAKKFFFEAFPDLPIEIDLGGGERFISENAEIFINDGQLQLF
jgi:hypothetical protein